MTAIVPLIVCGVAFLAAASFPAGDAVDSRGPIVTPGMQPVVSASGVQAPGYTFVNDCRKPTPWKALWIGPDAGASAAVCLFRKEAVFDAAPTKVTAWLSADCKYRLYINGRLVSRGPVDMGRDYAGGSTGRWFYDCRDLTPFFHKGVNVIAAEVFRAWPIGFTVSRGQSGFLFEAQATLPGRKQQTVASDTSWRCLPAPQYPDPSTYDSAREPTGWRMAGYNDSAWPMCRAVKDVWEPLTAKRNTVPDGSAVSGSARGGIAGQDN